MKELFRFSMFCQKRAPTYSSFILCRCTRAAKKPPAVVQEDSTCSSIAVDGLEGTGDVTSMNHNAVAARWPCRIVNIIYSLLQRRATMTIVRSSSTACMARFTNG